MKKKVSAKATIKKLNPFTKEKIISQTSYVLNKDVRKVKYISCYGHHVQNTVPTLTIKEFDAKYKAEPTEPTEPRSSTKKELQIDLKKNLEMLSNTSRQIAYINARIQHAKSSEEFKVCMEIAQAEHDYYSGQCECLAARIKWFGFDS